MITLPGQQQAAARLALQQRETQRQSADRHTQQQRDRQRQAEARHTQSKEPPSRAASEASIAAPRREARKPTREEDALFSELLQEEEKPSPLLAFNDSGSQQGFTQMEESSLTGSPPAMAMWQEIETDLLAAIGDRPPADMMLTLILPKLGHVDARLSALAAGGWDIALGLQPAAWRALLPHQERCRLSLRQRMGCRVRLSFTRRLAEPEA